MAGFRIAQDMVAGQSVIDPTGITAKSSTTYKVGDLLKVTNNIANRIAATDKPSHLYETLVTPASQIRPSAFHTTDADTNYELLAIPLTPLSRLEGDLLGTSAPTINNVACNSNTDKSTVKVTAAGSTGDFDGGTIYIPELNEQRNIVSGTVAGGVHTFTVDNPFSVAPSTSHTCRVVPWSKGSHDAVKFDSTDAPQGISTAVADKTGGKARIEGVDLARLKVYFSIPA